MRQAASKLPAAKGIARALPTSNEALLARPQRWVNILAAEINSGVRSNPVTRHWCRSAK